MEKAKEKLDSLKKLIDKEIKDTRFPKSPKGLYEPIEYVLESGGKRLRPLLLLSFVEALGGDPKSYLTQAVALEIYHNFTLLHDDVMDKAQLRHGRPTVHCKWNVPTAILSGDAMISIANLNMLAGLHGDLARDVISIFNDSALKVDQGQQLDMDFETLDNVTISEYQEMIMLKTGALFGCACGLGALLGIKERGKHFADIFKPAVKFGYLLGVAFQLQDDYLDTFGDKKTFGKSIGGDILNDKKTWLSVSLLNSGLKKDYLKIVADKDLKPDDKIAKVKDLYSKAGLREKLEKEIGDNIESMKRTLDEIKPHLNEDGLKLITCFIDTIVGRDR